MMKHRNNFEEKGTIKKLLITQKKLSRSVLMMTVQTNRIKIGQLGGVLARKKSGELISKGA